MKNYSKYSTNALVKMREIAWSEYYKLAVVAKPNPPTRSELATLEKAAATYNAINEEIAQRLATNCFEGVS